MRSIIKNSFSKSGIIVLGAILVAGFLVVRSQGPVYQVPEAHAQAECSLRVDLAFVIDTSGSMNDEWDTLCSTITDIVSELANDPAVSSVKSTIFALKNDKLCSTITVPNPPAGSEGEAWGPGSGWVATNNSWRNQTIKIIIPISDEGPEENASPCYNTVLEVPASIVSAVSGAGAIIVPILGNNPNDCAKNSAPSIAEATGAVDDTGNPLWDTLASGPADIKNKIKGVVLPIVLKSLDADDDGFYTNACAENCPEEGTCNDTDDQNEYVRPDAPEGKCDPAGSTCSIVVPGGTWPVGGTDYLNCTDYYADIDLSLSKFSPKGLTCTKTITATGKSFYTCTDDDGNPSYLPSDVISSANAIPINNNQVSGANVAELSCPKPGGLVPCGRYSDDPATPEDETEPCGFCHFFLTFDRIIDLVVLKIAPTIAVLLLIIGGLAVATSRGNQAQLTRGKDIIIWTFAGYAVILVGWMLLNSFFGGIGVKTWTGVMPEEINGGITDSVAAVDPGTDKLVIDIVVKDDELNGLLITITDPPASVLLGESRRIIDTQAPDTLITQEWDDPSDPGIELPAPGHEFKIEKGGWWQFTCGE